MIKKEKNQDSFLGSKILIRNGARLELPFKKKDEPIAVWKIISKFIGQDFTKVSMPVILNEPTSAL